MSNIDIIALNQEINRLERKRKEDQEQVFLLKKKIENHPNQRG